MLFKCWLKYVVSFRTW